MRLRTVLATVTAGLAAATTLTAAGPATAASSSSANACSPSVAIAGFSDALDKTTYEGTFVGNFSALAVDRNGQIAAVSDRSSSSPSTRRPFSPPVSSRSPTRTVPRSTARAWSSITTAHG